MGLHCSCCTDWKVDKVVLIESEDALKRAIELRQQDGWELFQVVPIVKKDRIYEGDYYLIWKA